MAAVVTGAGSGIGKELATVLAKSMKVFGVDKTAGSVSGSNIIPVHADFGTAEGVDAIKKAVGSEAVKFLALVGGSMISKPLLGMDRAGYDDMVGCHIMGPIFVTQALVDNLKAAGGARILMAFGGGADAHIPTFGAYGSTKAAMKTLWLALRDECADFAGVALAMPGIVKTPLWDPYLRDPDWPFKAVFGPRFDSGDCHQADEVAKWFAAILNLADKEAFKSHEWVIDDPAHGLDCTITETTEMKSIKAKT